MPIDPRLDAIRRVLEQQRSRKTKEFDWMSKVALGRAAGRTASQIDKTLQTISEGQADIQEEYKAKLGMAEADIQREAQLKKSQNTAAIIKAALTGVGAIAGTFAANPLAGAGIGSSIGGVLGSLVTGEPEAAAMAAPELITTIASLSQEDSLDKLMTSLDESRQSQARNNAAFQRTLRTLLGLAGEPDKTSKATKLREAGQNVR